MDSEKWIYDNENKELMEIPPINKICKILKEKFKIEENKIKYLEKEIESLKDEKWKDKQLKEMKNKYNKMLMDYHRGFSISEKEENAIKNWILNHERIDHPHKKFSYPRGGAIGGNYSYIFIPTEIGTFGSIKCSCGKEFVFQEGD